MKPATPFVERLRVFVASPGDVQRERAHVASLADELNRGVAAEAGFVLEVVRWETHARPDMGRPQQLIFDQIGAVDIFVGVMWQRFGTPTGVAGSGTEEEFEHAFTSWQRAGRPRILCYFSRAPIEPPSTAAQAEQLLKLAQFRERIEKEGLAWTYASDAEFKERLREHLQQVLLREFAGRRPPLDRNLLALLNVEKERCRERDVGFFTPNLLLSLLGAPRGAARRVFDSACPGKAEGLVEELRRYEPLDEAGSPVPFSDFDWYERDDVQAARQRAKLEGKAAIDGRHLLFGLLNTASQTRDWLRQTFGEDEFARLRAAAAEAPEARRGGTPGINVFVYPRDGD
ncbi:MAG TPA: DUF4062 domain-containing protein [Pyrinomonadaceae bacterium]|nr:DUF4062 domain-containing protein [Pyrinomonadaceae bacterium]